MARSSQSKPKLEATPTHKTETNRQDNQSQSKPKLEATPTADHSSVPGWVSMSQSKPKLEATPT